MNITAPLFFSVVVILGLAFLRNRARASRISRLGNLSWENLVARLEPVPIEEISRIALDYLHPHRGQRELDPSELWSMIGRAEGLRKMHANAEILLALANYAQRWNLNESVIVLERMRRDAMILRRAIFSVSLGLTFGYGSLRVPFSVQEAASAYYLMRARLLALYETSHAARLSKLAAAL